MSGASFDGVVELDVGSLDAVQHHVHRADAQHLDVDVVAREHRRLEVFQTALVLKLLCIVRREVARGRRKEARRSHRGIDDAVFEIRLDKFNHHRDDVAGRTELPVFAGRFDAVKKLLVCMFSISSTATERTFALEISNCASAM